MATTGGDSFADPGQIIAELRRERDSALAQKAALADVLEVINRSPGDPGPVFDVILERAMRLCEAAFGEFHTFDGENFLPQAVCGVPTAYAEYRLHAPLTSSPGGMIQRIRDGAAVLHIADLMAEEAYRLGGASRRALVDLGGARAALVVALRKDRVLLGVIIFYRQEPRPFDDRQIVLSRNFASQAVIAMENARLINEQREALEQQTATAEVLRVINASPGNLTPVFESLLDNAMRLCEASFGGLATFDGERFVPVALQGVPAAYAEYRMHTPVSDAPGSLMGRIRAGASILHIADLMEEEAYRDGDPDRRAVVDLGGARTTAVVALRKNDLLLGLIQIYRQEVRPFSERQIALL